MTATYPTTSTGGQSRLKIAPESIILSAICLLDLGSTVFWVNYREAMEGNPLMAFYLRNGGTPAFIAAKIVLLAMPLVIAEWARRSSPRFVQRALRFGIAAYLTLYVIGVARVNHDSGQTGDQTVASEDISAAAVIGLK